MNYRSMPADFHYHANEGFAKLMKHYHAGAEVIRRWKQLSGTLRPYNRPVIRTDADGNEKRYSSVLDASKDIFGASTSNIYQGLRKGWHSYGYEWRYDESEM